jgi:hypothetical protein
MTSHQQKVKQSGDSSDWEQLSYSFLKFRTSFYPTKPLTEIPLKYST